MHRATILAAVDSALRSDYFFLHALEAAIQRFKAEEQTLDSTTTLASTCTPLLAHVRPPALPRTPVTFPFYAAAPDGPSSGTMRVALASSTHTGPFRDYADFLILLAQHDTSRAHGGARWIMSMSAPGRGVFTSPEWLYRTVRGARFVLMAEQRGYERFLEGAAKAGAVLVRVGAAGPGLQVTVTVEEAC